MLARIVKEFSKDNVEQFVITLTGATSDFHYDSIKKHCRVLDWKRHSTSIEALLIEHPNITILAWMYPAIFFAHKLNIRLRTKHPIIWNIRHSSFGPSQWYQKTMLLLFGLASKILKNKIIYCSHKSKEVHERAFFKKTDSTVIVNRLAKKPLEVDVNKSIKNEKPFFLFVGRFNPQKGTEKFRSIISEKIIRNNPKIEVWIAGIGWDLNYFPKNIQVNIKLLGPREDVYALYTNAVGYLFTSTFGEGYPNVLAEASATGLPIIAFDAGDSKRILEAYDYGFIVIITSEFAEKSLWVLQNPITKDAIKKLTKATKTIRFFSYG